MSKSQSNLIETCFPTELSRRVFFDRMLKFGIGGAVATFIPSSLLARMPAPAIQDNWRKCSKCSALFFNGFRKGRCAAGRTHSGDDRNYRMNYKLSVPGQREWWRFCNKCDAMFFNGNPQKGACPGGGGHFADGYNFTVRSDNRAIGEHEWRFCRNCAVLFYNGENNLGRCAAAAFTGHLPSGVHYILDDTVRID